MLAVEVNEISIINDALTLVGHPAIHDLTGSIPASEQAARLYPLVLDQLLDSYPWRFAMRQAQLTRLTEKPKVNYTSAHKLPQDRDGTPRRFYSDTSGTVITDWVIYEDAVQTHSEVVYCDYVKKGGLTGTFRHLLVNALAASFAISLCDDRGLHDRYHQTAFGTPQEGGRGGLFKSAISTDAGGAQTRAVFTYASGPLVDAMR